MRAHDKSTAVPQRRDGEQAASAAGLTGLLALQRSIGNAAVGEVLRASNEQHVHGDGCGHGDATAVQRSPVEEVLRSAGRPLDAATRADKEAKFNADFSQVRVHTGPAAAESAATIQARAYTAHQDIVIGAQGGDSETLDHELTHVVRNQQRPETGSLAASGLSLTDPGQDSEREAAANAAQMRSGGPSQVLG